MKNFLKTNFAIFFFLLLPAFCFANNPLVTNVRTADANPFVYNDTFYIVCGQDEVNPNTFDMYAWRLLSSTNMRDWTDHGQILRPDQVSWMPDNCAWAAGLAFKNNYFYLYTANDFQVGVMRATSITGPYQDVLGRALITASTPGHAARDIDPMCFIDDDGQAYLFWGGDGNCRYARLNSDMISLATSVMDVPGLTSYLEAPFVIKTNGTYFLMYADSPWPSEIRYATASSVSGPWTYKGIIGAPTGSGTNHEGVAYYKGQWWYTYHTEELSNNNPYSRSVCVDKMFINGNTIQAIVYTDNNGGGVVEATPAPTAPPQSQNPIWSGGPYTLNNSYVDLPDGIVNSLYDYSIATWVNLSSVATWTRIFDIGTDTNANMFLTPMTDSGSIRFGITISGNSGEQRIDGSGAFATGSWQHVAVTRSGSLGILYVNGSEVGRNSSLTLGPADLGNTVNNFIGKSQYSTDPYLTGSVDKFYVYNRALSNTEVASLASSLPGTTTAPTAVPTAAPTVVPTAAPTASGILGDVNGSSIVDIVDALLVAQFYVGLSPANFNQALADVNRSGAIDIVDALLIAQYYVGIIAGF
jgi:hypothetical protein